MAEQIPDELDESEYEKYNPYALAISLGEKLNKALAELRELRIAASTPSAESAPQPMTMLDKALAQCDSEDGAWPADPSPATPPSMDALFDGSDAHLLPDTPPSESDRELAQRFMQELDEGEDCLEELIISIVSLCRQHFKPATIPLATRVAERLTREAATIPEARVDEIMAQVQVFASAYSLVGSRYDNGEMMTVSEGEKDKLRRDISAILAREATGGKHE